jgi:5-formyltetrahydrofolate cyclo-ligase
VTDKPELRTRIKATRAARSDDDRERDRGLIRGHILDWCHSNGLAPGARIAAYEPMRAEPGSIELLAELTRAGFEVIVPITLSDNDLDWGEWTFTRQARMPLGVDAISSAALVLVPAFAVDSAGRRLGRGGGSYDRALARVAAGVPVVAMLFEDELVAEVPVEEWDQPVTAVVTPSGWRALGWT